MNRGFRRYKKQNPNTGAVDLGLSDLARGDAEAPLPESTVEQSTENRLVQGPLNEYEQLAQEGRWNELRQLCEERLLETAENEDIEAYLELKLWWSLGQIETDGMPVSILAAPIESVVSAIQERRKSALWEESHKRLIALSARVRDAYHKKAGIGVPLFEVPISVGEPKVSEIGSPQAPAALPSTPSPVTPAIVEERKDRSPRVRPYLLLALLVFALIYGWQITHRTGLDLASDLQSTIASTVPPEEFRRLNAALLHTSPEYIESVSHLNAVMYGIEGLSAETPPGGRKAESSGHHEGREPVPQQPQLQPWKKSVDTSGPVEPAEVRRATTTGRENMAAETDAADVEEPQREAEIAGGRLPGTGRQGRSEIFPKARTYEVLVATSVMSEPSVRGQVLADLRSGERVLVEGREGYWLRIRSQSGRPGFLLAQDAAPERGW